MAKQFNDSDHGSATACMVPAQGVRTSAILLEPDSLPGGPASAQAFNGHKWASRKLK